MCGGGPPKGVLRVKGSERGRGGGSVVGTEPLHLVFDWSNKMGWAVQTLAQAPTNQALGFSAGLSSVLSGRRLMWLGDCTPCVAASVGCTQCVAACVGCTLCVAACVGCTLCVAARGDCTRQPHAQMVGGGVPQYVCVKERERESVCE